MNLTKIMESKNAIKKNISIKEPIDNNTSSVSSTRSQTIRKKLYNEKGKSHTMTL